VDRRRFLKYAGATAAVVGASALGLNYVSNEAPSTMSSTTSTTLSSESSTASIITPTQSVRLASLSGRLFFDYNGNGRQDGEEPAAAGAKVQLKDSLDNDVIAETVTDSSGDYTLEDLKIGIGAYLLHVLADKRFRYMCTSSDDVRPMSDGLVVSLTGGSEQLDIGLMEGFLTLPFDASVPVHIISYADLDPRPQQIRDWQGGRKTYDGHGGTDFDVYKQKVRAGAAGKIYVAASGWPNNTLFRGDRIFRDSGNFVWIDHSNGYMSTYNHLDEVLVSDTYYGRSVQNVERGQVIGISGKTGETTVYHLHMGCVYNGYTDRDLFRDLLYEKYVNTQLHSEVSSAVSLWTKDNGPQFPMS